MNISPKGRHAVAALVDLARHAGTRPVPLAEIAIRQAISLSYLEQLFALLRRGGLVHSVRGPGGGYLLARAPGAVSVADVVAAVDGAAPADAGTAGAEALWQALAEQVRLYLGAVSLADLAAARLPAPGSPVPAMAAR
ncbi:MAG: Rrf2 family transcriptional regulator [Thalassobaculales bacterium]